MKIKKNFRRLISDDTRYKILLELKRKDMCACSFVPIVKKSQPNVSIHLKKLEEGDIIESRREGTRIIYSLKNTGIKRLLELMEDEKIVKKT